MRWLWLVATEQGNAALALHLLRAATRSHLMLQRLVGKRTVYFAVTELQDAHFVSDAHDTGFDNPSEDALAGEDAVACQVVDRATRVADLSDLGDLDDRRANLQARAQRHALDVDAARSDVFGEIAVTDVEPMVTCNLYRFLRQERHLAMPVAGMRVFGNSEIGHELGSSRLDRRFAHALFGRDVH